MSVVAPLEPVALSAKLTKAQQAARDALAASLTGNEFAYEVRSDKANGPLFVDLAAGKQAPRIVMAALEAIHTVYAPEDDDRHLERTPDVRTVVLARLRAKLPSVQAQAFAAMPLLLGGRKVDESVPPALGALFVPTVEVAVRHAAAEALAYVSLYGLRDSTTLPAATLTAAVDPEPVVRVVALRHLMTFTRSQGFLGHAGHDRLLAVLQPALAADDLATRVTATSALGILATSLAPEARDAARDKFVALLDDPLPQVRAAAAMALAVNPHPKALPRLVALLDDKGPPHLTVKGPPDLTGKTIELSVSSIGHAPLTVGHAAVQSLMLAANGHGAQGFYCEQPSYRNEDKDLAACIVKARAWYARRTP